MVARTACPTGVRIPQQSRSEFTLRCILEGTRHELLRLGPKASIRDIAHRAGVAASTISERFASRDNLLEYLNEEECARGEEALDKMIDDVCARGLAPAELVETALRLAIDEIHERAPMAMVLQEIARDVPRVARRRAAFVARQHGKLAAAGQRHFGAAWTPATASAALSAAHLVWGSALAAANYKAFGLTSGANRHDAARELAKAFMSSLAP